MTTPKRRRHPKDWTLSQIFTAEFDAHPEVSYGDIARAVEEVTHRPITDQTISDYHAGKVKKRPNLIVIAAIAAFYELRTTDLPPDIAELVKQAHGVLAALVRSTPPGTRTRNLQNKGRPRRHPSSPSFVPDPELVAQVSTAA